MRFDGYDFIICGIIFATGGAFLLAKAYLMPDFLVETAGTYYDQNPFQLRNSIITKHEAIAGGLWILVAMVFSIIGTVRTAHHGQLGHLITSWFDILVVIAAFIILLRVTFAVTSKTSRNEYVPFLAESFREGYSLSVYVINNEGQYREEGPQNIKPTSDVAADRFKQARRVLDNIGKLLDVPRLPDENDIIYAERLSKHFPGIEPN